MLSLGACNGAESTITQTKSAIAATVKVDGAGVIRTGLANQPAATRPSVLVLSNEGRPVPAQTVNWMVTTGSGAVETSTTRTDTNGIASVKWIAGRRIGEDTVVAAVGALPPVVFRVVLDGIVNVTPSTRTFRAGATDSLRVTAADQAGVALEVPPLNWSSTTTAIRVSTGGNLTAIAEGTAALTGTGRGFTVSRSYDVGTVFRGRVIAIDQSPTTGLIASVHIAGVTDTGIVATDGRFSIATARRSLGATGDFTVDAAAGQARRFFPVLSPGATFDAPDSLVALLVPRVWRIQKGVYAGTDVELTIAGAYGPDDDGSVGHAYYQGSFFAAADRARISLGGAAWAGRDLPIAIYIDRSIIPDVPVRATDSVAFWESARDLERIVGRSLFRPAMKSDLLGRGTLVVNSADQSHPVGSMVLIGHSNPDWSFGIAGVMSGCYDGATGWRFTAPAFAPACLPAFDFVGAQLILQQDTVGVGVHNAFRRRDTVHHELLHNLGLGHTCAWPTVMRGGITPTTSVELAFCREILPDAPQSTLVASVGDVAHLEVWMEATARARESHARFRLIESANGERVFLRGLPSKAALSGIPIRYGR